MDRYSNKKIAWFHEKLVSLSAGIVTPPLYVRIKPTNKCSQKCGWCIYRPEQTNMHETCNNKDEIPTDKLLDIIDDLADIGVHAVTFTGAENPLFILV